MGAPPPADRSRSGCGCAGGPQPSRRDFLALSAAAAGAAALPGMPVMAGPFGPRDPQDPGHPVPLDKKLDPAWIAALRARGEPTVYRGWSALKAIGMPVGGIGCGTVYLGGDGRLWCWDIFGEAHEGVVPNEIWDDPELRNLFGRPLKERDGANYVRPPLQESPWNFEQGFAVRIGEGAAGEERSLDRHGFAQLSFRGQYPAGTVRYADPGTPLEAELTAFTPFVPLDVERSSFPATVLRWRLRNGGGSVLPVELRGRMGNPVLRGLEGVEGVERFFEVLPGSWPGFLVAARRAAPGHRRPDIPFDGFERSSWRPWKASGEAFAGGPFPLAGLAPYQHVTGARGERYVNSHNTRRGGDVRASDDLTGVLESPSFRIRRRFVRLLLGGGRRPGEAFVEVVVAGETVARATGHDGNDLRPVSLAVAAWEGREARLRVVDRAQGGWGNIQVDEIVFSDRPAGLEALAERTDFGSLALLAADGDAEILLPQNHGGGGQASLRRRARLQPGESLEVSFVLAWYFPNVRLPVPGLAPEQQRRHYAARFADAGEVALAVAGELEELTRLTLLWRDSWYGGTLPCWFLERTLIPAGALQTSTFHRLQDGRVWAWEGIGCCAGTCTHVWHYAQAMARLFPELERDLRERTDFGVAFREQDGVVDHRGGMGVGAAIDGQAGVVLRTWREHQVSWDDSFLRRVWPRCRRAVEFLIAVDGRDGPPDGVPWGAQPNTLDAAWYGKIPAMASMYLAALHAAAAMAERMGEAAFAARCRDIAARGAASFQEMWDEEAGYFVQLEDPEHLDAIGVGRGCHIDQVLGQSWAFQVGLPRLCAGGRTRRALRSLWDFNFCPDMRFVRESVEDPRLRGRAYALAGEAGLVMCTWPHGGRRADWEKHWQYGYFNECMTGFEYQAAAHMIAEGEPDLVEHGLAVCRAIHDRYDARRRNPYNEIECSDHYARAMAAYGAFLAACGFELDGPAGHLGFAPKLRPESFEAAWTGPRGWGVFRQGLGEVPGGGQELAAEVELRHGSLRLRSLGLAVPAGARVREAAVGREPARFRQAGRRVRIQLPAETVLEAPAGLHARLRWGGPGPSGNGG